MADVNANVKNYSCKMNEANEVSVVPNSVENESKYENNFTLKKMSLYCLLVVLIWMQMTLLQMCRIMMLEVS